MDTLDAEEIIARATPLTHQHGHEILRCGICTRSITGRPQAQRSINCTCSSTNTPPSRTNLSIRSQSGTNYWAA
jgi:hypothetical protein